MTLAIRQTGNVDMSGATSDAHLISLWLNQKGRRSQNTKRVYEHEVKRFLDIVQKPLRAVTVVDMQGYMERLEGLGLSDATQARALSTVRSLFSFALKVGYVPASEPPKLYDRCLDPENGPAGQRMRQRQPGRHL